MFWCANIDICTSFKSYLPESYLRYLRQMKDRDSNYINYREKVRQRKENV